MLTWAPRACEIAGHTLEAPDRRDHHDGFARGLRRLGNFYDIRRYGGLQIFLRAIIGGGSMVLSQPEEPVTDHVARLNRMGVTHISGTPSHWRKLLMSGSASGFSPSYVRLSGEIADQAVLDGLSRAYPKASIGHAYASTEAGVGFAVNDGREGFPAHMIGASNGGVEMKVEDGSLRIRSTRTAHAYVGRHPAALTDRDGFVDTGDMVELRGDRYHFVGRRGGIINIGGAHPEESVSSTGMRRCGCRVQIAPQSNHRRTVADALADSAGRTDEIRPTFWPSAGRNRRPQSPA